MSDERPKCPDHPGEGVASARSPGSDEYSYFCLKCGQNLGPAPSEGKGDWEPFVIDGKL